MKKFHITLILALILAPAALFSQTIRKSVLLDKNWKFIQSDVPEALKMKFDDQQWQTVNIPHDWAIFGPFDEKHDLQIVAVTQNGESKATKKTGRTGGLPYTGVGWYRTTFSVPEYSSGMQKVNLLFDGAMSEARVFVNEKEVIFWPNGYNSFFVDVTDALNADGQQNILAVRLENREQSSRWYSGAGLYRNVHLIVTENVHVPVWGTYLTTPYVSADYASVKLETSLENVQEGAEVRIETIILDKNKKQVAIKTNTQKLSHKMPLVQNFIVNQPELWTPESPVLYFAESKIYLKDKLVDTYSTRFGIRSIQFIADKGFFLNGKLRKFQGVCNHHDLGPIGAAVNKAALRRQLTLLKDMGADAIRTSHNMPAPELAELCDEMGFMMMIEPFDEWDRAKCQNGYHRYFQEWAEKDMVNMLHNYRNHPSVVMWSIGNEVPTQCSPEGYKVAKFLQDICHREDPTRPVTCGMDQVSCVLKNGFAALIDIPGFNYRVNRYQEGFEKLPQNLLLGSETASTVSSRGVYKFPVKKKADAKYEDHQSTGYDFEYCSWSNLPDLDFSMAEDYPWTLGQFVWTGFDYLGEPSPYDTDAWPSHSSLFGIIDLASLPKDRYYLYRSVWNKTDATLHVLPHWTWKGKEGDTIPVFVYTSYPSAELFINGKSQGIQSKNNSTLENRYRLMWMNTIYQPGELKVVAYDAAGKAVAEKVIRTAGKAHHLELIPDRKEITADGKDLAYITVRVVDKAGNLCPDDASHISFNVEGAGKYKAAANGDATCLDQFHLPKMHAFSGELTMIVQAGESAGKIIVKAKAKGLKEGVVIINVKLYY
jgi:beta-galactosidase